MATWEEFAASDPALARFGHERVHKYGQAIGFLATVRHDDGGPRVHPVCLIFADGRMYVTIPRVSPKTRDLQANPNYMFHSFPDREDPEFSMRGRTRPVTEAAQRLIVADAATFATGVQDDEDVFELDIERADSTTWMNWAQADTYPVRKSWRAP